MTDKEIGWLSLMAEVYAVRSSLLFSQRLRFDKALRPPIKGEALMVIDYPDAIYHITDIDVARAKAAVENQNAR